MEFQIDERLPETTGDERMSHEIQRDIVLRRLEQGPATVRDFMQLGISRFGARIWELRKRGYEIVSSERRVNGQRHVTYRLLGQAKLWSEVA